MKYYVDYTKLSGLDSDELKSILKSNSMSWNERHKVGAIIDHECIKELLPLIAAAAVGATIIGMMGEILKEKQFKEE